MNVVDTSGWLEYFAEGKNAAFFAPAIEKTEHRKSLPGVQYIEK